MKRVYLTWTVALLLVLFTGCGKRLKDIGGNEELRLRPDQIEAYEKSAQEGDATAAKKLWHHYTFVEGDLDKGEMWRKTYERLSKKEN